MATIPALNTSPLTGRPIGPFPPRRVPDPEPAAPVRPAGPGGDEVEVASSPLTALASDPLETERRALVAARDLAETMRSGLDAAAAVLDAAAGALDADPGAALAGHAAQLARISELSQSSGARPLAGGPPLEYPHVTIEPVLLFGSGYGALASPALFEPGAAPGPLRQAAAGARQAAQGLDAADVQLANASLAMALREQARAGAPDPNAGRDAVAAIQGGAGARAHQITRADALRILHG